MVFSFCFEGSVVCRWRACAGVLASVSMETVRARAPWWRRHGQVSSGLAVSPCRTTGKSPHDHRESWREARAHLLARILRLKSAESEKSKAVKTNKKNK